MSSEIPATVIGEKTEGCGNGKARRYWPIALLLLSILLTCSIRYRLRDLPLERDVGEYAYAGQMILHGSPPFQHVYNLKFPGTYAAYAVILAVFGQTPAGVNLGLMVVNAATIVVLYLLALRLLGSLAAVVAAASYAVLSVGPSVLGIQGHATHFVVLPALCGLLLLEKALENDRALWIFFAAVLLGVAFPMKQAGVFFPLFGGLYVVYRTWRTARADWRRMATRACIYSAGAVLPFAVMCLLLAAAGTFHKFWFWTVSYAMEHGSLLTAADGWQNFRETFPEVAGPAALIWLLAGMGLLLIPLDRIARKRADFLTGFLLFSAAAVCTGFYFREHYFIMVLPAISLLAGVAVSASSQALRSMTQRAGVAAIPVILFCMAIAYTLYGQRVVLFESSPFEVCRELYQLNPFAEALPIGEYIRTHSEPSDTVVVMGSEPEILFYARRRSATGYVHVYPLVERQKYARRMQEEMIAEIEAARPQYMVSVRVDQSWSAQEGFDRRIFLWMRQYLQEHYELVGVTDITDVQHKSTFVWGEAAKTYRAQSEYAVFTYRRID